MSKIAYTTSHKFFIPAPIWPWNGQLTTSEAFNVGGYGSTDFTDSPNKTNKFHKSFQTRDLPQFEDWLAGRNQFMRTMAFTSYDHFIIQAIFNVEPRYDFASFKRRRYDYRNRLKQSGTLYICLRRCPISHTGPLPSFSLLCARMSLAIRSISALNASKSLRSLGNSLHKNLTSSAKAFSICWGSNT